MKLLNSYLKALVVSVLGLLVSCAQPTGFYKKEFSKEEQMELAKQLIAGRGFYYQGSEGEQLILQESFDYDSTNATIWREFGVPYLKRGIAAEWRYYYDKAVEIDPLNWEGWMGYLHLYFYRDYENAIKNFDKTDELTPDIVDYPQSLSVDYMRGICYLKLDKYDKALFYFNKHIEYEKQSTGIEYIGSHTFLYKGITLMKMNQFDKAIEAFELGLVHNKDNCDLMFWLSKLKHKNGEHVLAVSLIRKAIIQFEKGHFNSRPYTEDFFQTYLPDLEDWELRLNEEASKKVRSI